MKTGLAVLGVLSGMLPMYAQKPHIILIMTDQQRGDALGCMGNEAILTPNLDNLAKDGYIFTNAYSSLPSSTPARASLLTGMSPWKHGMLGYGKIAEHYKYEKPKILKDLGYYTFGIGKMHYEPQNALHGYNVTLLDESGRKGTPDFVSHYRAWFQLKAPGENPDKLKIWWNDHRAETYKLDESLHPTSWTTQMGKEFISNYNLDQPLFLKISYARPHSPYDPPEPYLRMYDNIDIPEPAIGDWCEAYSSPKKPEDDFEAPIGNFGEEYVKNSKRHYYASITFIDSQIAEILQTLKDKGMYENSLILFISDHGDMMGDHYHWRKTYPYQGSVHIPFIVKLPKSMINVSPTGSKFSQPVELRDALPTFIDAAGGTIPEDMDGCSVIDLIEGKNNNWREFIDLEHSSCYWKENYWSALTDGNVKYIWYFMTGQELLFDLKKDPRELHNCIKDDQYSTILNKMRKHLADHLSERGDGFVKDRQLVIRNKTLLYSPNYPKTK